MKRKHRIREFCLILVTFFGILLTAWCIFWNFRSSPKNYIKADTTNPLIAGDTLLCAHRSGGGVYPEESLYAFENCAESAEFHTDFFEFDLHLTKDKYLVLLHDDGLDRTTDSRSVFGESGVIVRDKTLEELKQLNIGARFITIDGEMPYREYSGSGVPDELRILTLGEALDYLTEKGNYHYIIEIKDAGEDGMTSADILYGQLKERGFLQCAVICSFHDEVLEYVDGQYPDALRGAGIDETLEFVFAAGLKDKEYEPKFDAVQLPYGNVREAAGLNLGLVSIINYAYAHDVAVQYWTINNVEDMKYLKSLHVDVIMTDYPETLAKVLEQ